MLPMSKVLLGRSVKSLIVLLVLLRAAQSAKAVVWDGDDLYALCHAPANLVGNLQTIRCMGYIEGVIDATTVEICGEFTGGFASGQLVGIVSQYLSAHPAQRQLPASTLVLLALMEAFPCHK
jgi:hypothetical protein